MWRMIVYVLSGILQIVVLVLMIRETRRVKKLQRRTADDKPKSLKLSGWNKHHKLIFYECPVCEVPFNNVYLRNNHLKPSDTFTCDLCGAKLSVPDYKRFKYR